MITEQAVTSPPPLYSSFSKQNIYQRFPYENILSSFQLEKEEKIRKKLKKKKNV